MKLTVTGRRVAVTEAARLDIAKKMRRLERVLDDSAVSAQIVLSRDGRTSVCDLTIHARGDNVLHGVGKHERQGTAVTAAVEKVDKQARSMKGRWKTRRRTAAAPAPNATAGRAAASQAAPGSTDGDSPSPARRPNIVRRRMRLTKPMTVEDAVLALEDRDPPVVIFRTSESSALRVLHRQADGRLVLIEPVG